MNNAVISLLTSVAALATGGAIGFLFGTVQNSALARNKKLGDKGKLRGGWGLMPGSMSRVAVLLVVLVGVQVLCPMFFEGNIQWLVSAGVLLGYGFSFVKRLDRRAEERI